MAAVTQIRQRHSAGRAYFEKKLADGKTRKEGTPRPQTAHQRRRLRPPSGRRPASSRERPGRATGERLCRQRGRLTPQTPALRPSHSRTSPHTTTPVSTPARPHQETAPNLLTQRGIRYDRLLHRQMTASNCVPKWCYGAGWWWWARSLPRTRGGCRIPACLWRWRTMASMQASTWTRGPGNLLLIRSARRSPPGTRRPGAAATATRR